MLQVRKSTLSLLFILLTIKFRSIPALEPALNQVQQLDPISHKPSWFPHNIDNYVLFDKNMVACIMLHSAIQISFPVKNENDQVSICKILYFLGTFPISWSFANTVLLPWNSRPSIACRYYYGKLLLGQAYLILGYVYQ